MLRFMMVVKFMGLVCLLCIVVEGFDGGWFACLWMGASGFLIV